MDSSESFSKISCDSAFPTDGVKSSWILFWLDPPQVFKMFLQIREKMWLINEIFKSNEVIAARVCIAKLLLLEEKIVTTAEEIREAKVFAAKWPPNCKPIATERKVSVHIFFLQKKPKAN